jgi:hypothetical protein
MRGCARAGACTIECPAAYLFVWLVHGSFVMLAHVAGVCACADVRFNACVSAQGHASAPECPAACLFMWLVQYGFLLLARVVGACAYSDLRLNACAGAKGHARVHQSASSMPLHVVGALQLSDACACCWCMRVCGCASERMRGGALGHARVRSSA